MDMSKKELRKQILQKRDALSIEERKHKSVQITKRVIAHKGFQEADIILLFASYKSEVDTTEIFKEARKEKKAVYYPKVIGNEMKFYLVEQEADFIEGYRGIREPEDDFHKQFLLRQILSDTCEDEDNLRKQDKTDYLSGFKKLHLPNKQKKICVIMPGAVFDEAGNRIGYGGGYYDKYFETMEKVAQKQKIMLDSCLCKIAVAFACQLVAYGQIQVEKHDIKPNYIITEEQIISCKMTV